MVWVTGCVIIGILGIISAYTISQHFAIRINSFLGIGTEGDNYQVSKALEAFNKGGLFGTGPGEGTVKQHLRLIYKRLNVQNRTQAARAARSIGLMEK